MTEAKLQSDIHKLLERLGIVVIRSRFDKKSTTAPGTPDFLFSIRWKGLTVCTYPCAWEIKMPKKKLRPEQNKMRERMETSPNAWRYCVITSVDAAISELKLMGMVQQ